MIGPYLAGAALLIASAIGGMVAWDVQAGRLNRLAASYQASATARQAAIDRQITENAERERLDVARYRGINDDQTKQLDSLRISMLADPNRLRGRTAYVYRDRARPDVAAAAPGVPAAGAVRVLAPGASADIADAIEDESDGAAADALSIGLGACYARAITDRLGK